MGNTGSIFCSIFRTTKRDGGSQRQGRSPFPSSGRDKHIRPLRLSNLWPQIAGKLDWVGQLLGKPVLPGRAGPLLEGLQEGSLLPRVVPMVHGPSGTGEREGGRTDVSWEIQKEGLRLADSAVSGVYPTAEWPGSL